MPITEEQKLRIAEIARKINDSTDADYYRKLVSRRFADGGDTDDDDEIIGYIDSSGIASRQLKPWSRRAIKAFANEDFLNQDYSTVTEGRAKTRKQRLYNRTFHKAADEYAKQEADKALERMAIEELQTGKPTGAFKELARQGVESGTPIAAAIMTGAVAPWLAQSVPVLGSAAAKGLELMGEYAMPSTFLKGVSSVIPSVSKAAAAASPWLDAGALSLWSAQGMKHVGERWKEGDKGTAIAEGALASLPVAMPLGIRAYQAGKSGLNKFNNLRNQFKVTPEDFKGIAETMYRDNTANFPDRKILTAEELASKREAATTGYQVERYPGYMLKSLMSGNPLEKQIGKNGTVNVNNVRALINKGSKVEQAVVDKVLASEEFAGRKSIDYNKFRKAVQDELITYERHPDSRWEDYGMDRILIDNPRNSIWKTATTQQNFLKDHPELKWTIEPDGYFSITSEDGIMKMISPEESNAMFPGWVDKYSPSQTQTNTYTFSSPRIPNGSSKHYDPNTLGHSRTYTTADEPDILHVMESQSDWGQHDLKKSLGMEQAEEGYIYSKRDISNAKEILKNKVNEFGEPLTNDDIDFYKRKIADAEARYNFWEKRIADIKRNNAQSTYLHDNFTSRQIQENLRYAAEKGQTKMRYPTRETAAKIEGYPEREAYFNEKGEDVTTTADELFTFGDKLDARKAELIEKMKALKNESLQNYGIDFSGDWWVVPDTERRQWNKNRDLYNKYSDELLDIVQGKKGEAKLKHGITKKTVYDYEDILKRYSAFPKQYKKLYKNADVRIVTDPKGNTWYEVDVPENYLQQEWAYKQGGPLLHDYTSGGKIHIKPENRGKFTALKERTGHSATWFKEHGTPAQKKMAVFALNAKHWNHADGGPMSRGLLTPDALPTLLQQFTPNRQTVDYPQVEPLNLPEQYVPEPAVIRTPIVDLSKYETAPEVVVPYTPEASAEIIANQEYDSMLDNILNRQRYAESGFNDRAVNKSSGATGAYQIMPIAYKDYLQRGHGKEGDLMNASYNRLVRDHVVKMVPRDLGSEFYSPADTAINRHAKEMAVFNAGAGPVKRALRKAKAAGVDIVNTTDWIQYLPSKETRDYVNFVVLDQDIAGTGKNAEAYNRAYSRFQKRRDLGGMIERMKSLYNNDRQAMLNAVSRSNLNKRIK